MYQSISQSSYLLADNAVMRRRFRLIPLRIGNFEVARASLNCQNERRTTYIHAYIQGAANKSNPLPCFVNISTTNLNFYKKIYAAISHSYLHIIAKLRCIITTFD